MICVCGKECNSSRGYKIHTSRCEKFLNEVKEELSKEFFDQYCGEQNMPLFTLTKDVLNSKYSYNLIVKIAEKYGYKPLSKSEANKRSKEKRIQTNIERSGSRSGYVQNSFTYIKDGEKVTISRDYIESIMNQEFFDKYIGKENMVISDIQKNILNGEFSYATVLSYARKFGYDCDNRSDAAKRAHESGKNQKTSLEHYGVENPSQSQEIKDKKIQTMFSNFGVRHHLKLRKQKEKQRLTIRYKYKTDNVSQIPEVKEKKEIAFLKHYGYKNIFCDSDLIRTFFQQKFGVDNVSQLNWVEKKKKDTLLKNYGVENFGLLSSNFKASKTSQSMFTSIFDNLSEPIQKKCKYFDLNEEQFLRFDNFNAYLDFSIIDNDRICIEFNGDYWHMNPKFYKVDDINPTSHKTAQEIWDKDKIRYNYIHSAGFKLLVIWESEYVNEPEQTLNKCLFFINEHIPGSVNEII